MFNASSQLESLIARSVPGCLPEQLSLTPLTGLTGTSWRIDLHHQPRWLAKPRLASQDILGIYRHQEYRTLRRISGAGISPQPVLLTDRWMISSWIEGQVLGDRFSHDCGLDGIANSLVRLHRLPPNGFSLNLKQRFERYLHGIDKRRLSPRWLALHQRYLNSSLPRPLKLAPAHLDLHGDNAVLCSNCLMFIDWEYSSDADIAFELAMLFCGNRWNKGLETDLLQRYINAGGYSDGEKLRHQIDNWKPYVEYLILLWFETRWQQTKNQQYLIDCQPIRIGYGI